MMFNLAQPIKSAETLNAFIEFCEYAKLADVAPDADPDTPAFGNYFSDDVTYNKRSKVWKYDGFGFKIKVTVIPDADTYYLGYEGTIEFKNDFTQPISYLMPYGYELGSVIRQTIEDGE